MIKKILKTRVFFFMIHLFVYYHVIDSEAIETSSARLNSSLLSGAIHWSEDGSQHVMILLWDTVGNSTSDMFLSKDDGRTFSNISSLFVLPGEGNSSASLSRFYQHPRFNSLNVFTDEKKKVVFVMEDPSYDLAGYRVDFFPSSVVFHPSRQDLLFAHDSFTKSFWISDSFGSTWSVLQRYVESFSWYSPTPYSEPELYLLHSSPGSGGVVVSYSGNFSKSSFVIQHVSKFVTMGNFRFAILDKGVPTSDDNTVELWLSFKGDQFRMALFTGPLLAYDYHIVDVTDDQIMVAVNGKPSSSIYVSNVVSAVSPDARFSLSLDNIIYNSKRNNDSFLWMSYFDDFIDVHRVNNMRGVFVANHIVPHSNTSDSGSIFEMPLHRVVSVITWNKGGEWAPVKAPIHDVTGSALNCSLKSNCSLHLSQSMGRLYPGTRYTGMVSSWSASGLIISTAVIGSSFKGEPCVALSRDAGVSWKQVLLGEYLFAIGDYGGLLVAVARHTWTGPTGSLRYSTDFGETWHHHQFSQVPVFVYSLTSAPGDGATSFILFGISINDTRWTAFRVDLRSVFERNCTDQDYKVWSLRSLVVVSSFSGRTVSHRACHLGRRQQFRHRSSRANCFSGQNFSQPFSSNNCLCGRHDFQCDFGYVVSDSTAQGACVPSAGNSSSPPRSLSELASGCAHATRPGFFDVSRGYVKIGGDTCVPYFRSVQLYEPETHACPVNNSDDFLLLVNGISGVFKLRLDDISSVLNTNTSVIDNTSMKSLLPRLPLLDNDRAVAVEFDLHSNCLFWSTVDSGALMMQCLNGSAASTLLRGGDVLIEALSYDWTSGNLYMVDSKSKKIDLVRPRSSHSTLWRRNIFNKSVLDKPRGLALHPRSGMLFFSDWSSSRPGVFRSVMDGSGLQLLVGSVARPNGLTLDFDQSRLYWTDAQLDQIGSCALDGTHLLIHSHLSRVVQHPFSLTVYKHFLFVNDWQKRALFLADLRQSDMVSTVISDVGLLDVKVYGSLSQRDSSSCTNSSQCAWLCVPLSHSQSACLCPFPLLASAGGDHTCLCPGGFPADHDLACPPVSNTSSCQPHHFSCANGLCALEQWRCDGHNDCGDLSDEINCTTSCTEDQFQCSDGACISSALRCDKSADCPSAEDELNCSTPSKCGSGELVCENGRCVTNGDVCDGEDDCGDMSDERNCTETPADVSCSDDEFVCARGHGCISRSFLCDNHSHCDDNSDEDAAFCANHTCLPGRFKCLTTHKCVFVEWRCDGESDCDDGSDETDCHQTTVPVPISTSTSTNHPTRSCDRDQFRCDSGECISASWLCDGADDCTDKSDEANCASSRPPPTPATTTTPSSHSEHNNSCSGTRYRCFSGQCIWLSWTCDGDVDCSGGDDEAGCNHTCSSRHQFRCALSGECVERQALCDGSQDCLDRSDEQNCQQSEGGKEEAALFCPPGSHACLMGNCLPNYRVCDGVMDCLDGSDEADCIGKQKIYQVVSLSLNFSAYSSENFSVVWKSNANTSEERQQLSFLPSICTVYPGSAVPCRWVNESWTPLSTHMFLQLTAYTRYNVTVFVRHEQRSAEFAPFLYLDVTTKPAAPTPARDVTVIQQDITHILVKWKPPVRMNGEFERYQVSMSVRDRPVTVFNATHTNITVEQSFVAGFIYSFTVVVFNRNYHSVVSAEASVNFDGSALVMPVERLTYHALSNHSSQVSWRSLSAVDKYVVDYKSRYNSMEPVGHVTTNSSSVTLTNLSAGTVYSVTVRGFRRHFSGTARSLTFSTAGLSPPSVADLRVLFSDGDSLTLTWSSSPSPDFVPTYGVFWGQSEEELLSAGVRLHTHKTEAMVSHLMACEHYLMTVAVVGPSGWGNRSSYLTVTTDYNSEAPPKHLRATAVVGDPLRVNVTWMSSCPHMKVSESYVLTVNETSLGQATRQFHLANTMKTHLSQLVSVAYGGVYNISVRTNTTSSVAKIPIIIYTAQSIPAPDHLRAEVFADTWHVIVEFSWRDQTLPFEIRRNRYSYLLDIVEGMSMLSNKSQSRAVSNMPLVVSDLRPSTAYSVQIRLVLAEGFRSPPSDFITFLTPALANAGQVVGSGLMTGVVLVSLLLLFACSGLGVVLYKHRRTRQHFLSFVQAHYRVTPSGGVFADGNFRPDSQNQDLRYENDNSRLSISFSDTEPLVVA